MTFQIVGGQWCNHEPIASVDMFPKEIFEILII